LTDALKLKQQGLTYAEIGKQLGISRDAARWRCRQKTPVTSPDVSSLASELRRLRRELDNAQLYGHVIQDCIISTLSTLEPTRFTSSKHGKGDAETGVLVASDYHFGEKVLDTDTYGTNTYSMKEAHRRLNKIYDATLSITSLQRKAHPIDELVILMIGDIATGECLYRGQAYRIDATLMEQILTGGHWVATLINDLSAVFPSIRIEAMAGNHGRVRDHDTSTNWDTILYHQIKHELSQNKRIKMNIHDGTVDLVEINGRTVAISHGHTLSRGALLETAMGRAATAWPDLLRNKLQGRQLDLCVFGHYHASAAMQLGSVDVISNGSMVGGTSFAANSIRRINPPRQWFFGIHPERITWRYALELD